MDHKSLHIMLQVQILSLLWYSTLLETIKQPLCPPIVDDPRFIRHGLSS
jgi:hypothetical protein